MPASHTSNLPILAAIQPVDLRHKRATLSPARCAMEPGHLLHSVLTHTPDGNARHLKSRHQFASIAQKLICLSDDNNIRAALWADHRWLVVGEHYETPYFHSRHRHPPSGAAYVRLKRMSASAPVSDVSAPAYTNGYDPFCGL